MRLKDLSGVPSSLAGKTGWPWEYETGKMAECKPDGSFWPKISIVTPSYNQGKYIEETIRSVLLQDYPNLEYVVIDGGSTDNSLEIIKKYERFLTYWVSEPDKGQSHAINKGLAHCSGEIFNWLNSDDLLCPNALWIIAKAWKNNPGTLIAGTVQQFDENGPREVIVPNEITLNNFVNRYCHGEINKLVWHQPGIFCPLEAVKKCGGCREDVQLTMDRFLMIELLQENKVAYVDSVLAMFRYHSASKTISDGNSKFNLEFVEKIIAMGKLPAWTSEKKIQKNHIWILLLSALEQGKKYNFSCALRYIIKAFSISFLGTVVNMLKMPIEFICSIKTRRFLRNRQVATSEKKNRVLQIISAPVTGGIESQLLLLLQRYNMDRFVIDVACTKSITGNLRDRYLETGTRLIECQWSSYIIPYVWRLFRLLRRERYDVVHTNTSMVSGAAILASRLAGVPIRIATYHNIDAEWRHPGTLNRLAVGILQWMTRRWATKILSVSRANLDLFYPDWEQHPEQFELCFNGIVLSRFSGKIDPDEVKRELGIPVDSLVVGNVGTLRKQKNHQTFIDVAERLSKQFEDIYFLIVGDGSLHEQLEREVEQRGLSKQFVFTGNRSDIPRMLAPMDVFLIPSLYEGFGIVAIEAQMCEVPVVASEIPCIREALCPGMQDFFFDVHDDKGMAEQIKILLENPEWRHKLGKEGRGYVEKRFSIDKTVEQLESLYTPNYYK